MNWGYVSGYFDGEGSVVLHQGKRPQKACGLIWHNTHLPSLEAMRDFIRCGKIYKRAIRPERHKPGYTLEVRSKSNMIKVGSKMLPYLIIKRDQCENLIQYVRANVGTRAPGFGKVAALSDEQLRLLYWVEQKSFSAIAKEIGVSMSAIAQAFRLRGIKTRPFNGGFMKGHKKSLKTLRRMRASRRRMWANPEYRAKHLAILAEGRRRWHESRSEQLRSSP